MTIASFKPLYISKPETGLVKQRPEFLLPDDAYPILENAYVWREKILRKRGTELLGRLRRLLTSQNLGNTDGSGNFSGNIITILGLESNAEIESGSISVDINSGSQTFTEPATPDGTLSNGGSGTGTINYATGDITIDTDPDLATVSVDIDFNYFPNLPVMGLRQRELNGINVEQLIAFDTTYAYNFSSGFQEFLSGTTWSGSDSNFFWSTNYWVDNANRKLFWVTNNSGSSGDPIRYTNGVSWADFEPEIDASGNKLTQCLALLPFRGRLVAFNTLEGATLGTSTRQRQRIRWARIGSPLYNNALSTDFDVEAWRDDIRGKGGFLDIPTAEDIITVGFVRDNLVIYCERSTWQLRYTGLSIAPFQIEKINTELGAESTFSLVQFDTSLVGIGDKGIVECDSYQAQRIDIKIPDLTFVFQNQNNGLRRVHGIRDFRERLAYWIYATTENNPTFPNRRLVYNYENDSWAIFKDSFTALGTFQPQNSRRWQDLDFPWEEATFPWVSKPAQLPALVAGNQKGYISFIDSKSRNDPSLNIKDITGNATAPTRLNINNHNLETGYIIEVSDIIGSAFSGLNGTKFAVDVIDDDNVDLFTFDTATERFNAPQLDAADTYLGGGQVKVLDNFVIRSKKFNFFDQAQQIALGFVDALVDATNAGQISLYVYTNYFDSGPVNIYPENDLSAPELTTDTHFNVNLNTDVPDTREQDKAWKRVYCNTRANELTLEWTLSPSQMNGTAQESEVQINAQIIWMRPGGRLQPIGN